jgi:hypothetical protein
MRNTARVRTVRAIACAVVLGAALGGSISSASASDASIKSVIKSYGSRILLAEGHVLTALGEYKKTGNPREVTTTIGKSIVVLRSLKSALGAQSASSPKVSEGKVKFEKGLKGVIVAYQHLKTAFGEKKARPRAAKRQARKALKSIDEASGELKEGAKLIG